MNWYAAAYVAFLAISALWSYGNAAMKKNDPAELPWKADEVAHTTNQKGGAA